jgi:parallel beta-helix repeat protein
MILQMKVIVGLLLSFSLWARASTYYVANAGNDLAAGTSASAPWKTVSHVNEQRFAPGDSILFKRGNMWREVPRPPSSGDSTSPIRFGAYGMGERPVFNAAVLMTGWTPVRDQSGNVTPDKRGIVGALWMARLSRSPNQVFFDGKLGTRRSSLSTLAASSDWYWASGFLYVYSKGDPSNAYAAAGIEASSQNSAIDTNNQSDLIFENLKGEYANSKGGGGIVIGSTSSHITISNCEFSWNYGNGVWIYQTAGGNLRISNNDIHDNSSGIYESQYAGGTALSPVRIDHNAVHDNVGGDGIAIYGNYFTVDHNAVFNNGRLADTDSIGIHIYTGDRMSEAKFGQNNVVSWNVVRGQRSNGHDGSGIEVDHYTANNTIEHNLLYHNYGPGIDLFDCSHVNVYQNTAYGNSINSTAPKAEISLSTLGEDLVKYVSVTNNIGFATCSACFAIYIDRGTAGNVGIALATNLWYSTSKDWYGGVEVGGSLSYWNSAMPFVHNDIYGDPLFKNVAESDYSLSRLSPARNAGTVILGQPLASNPPDLGALPY